MPGQQRFELAGDVPGVVLEVPGRIREQGVDGQLALLGVEARAGPGLVVEGAEPVAGPEADGVDDGDVPGDGAVAPAVLRRATPSLSSTTPASSRQGPPAWRTASSMASSSLRAVATTPSLTQ